MNKIEKYHCAYTLRGEKYRVGQFGEIRGEAPFEVMNDILPKLDFFSYIFVSDSIRVTSTVLSDVIQVHQFWCQFIAVCNFPLVYNTNLRPISHRSKDMSWCIGQIFDVDKGVSP